MMDGGQRRLASLRNKTCCANLPLAASHTLTAVWDSNIDAALEGDVFRLQFFCTSRGMCFQILAICCFLLGQHSYRHQQFGCNFVFNLVLRMLELADNVG